MVKVICFRRSSSVEHDVDAFTFDCINAGPCCFSQSLLDTLIIREICLHPRRICQRIRKNWRLVCDQIRCPYAATKFRGIPLERKFPASLSPSQEYISTEKTTPYRKYHCWSGDSVFRHVFLVHSMQRHKGTEVTFLYVTAVCKVKEKIERSYLCPL